jgi:hypothetical protein
VNCEIIAARANGRRNHRQKIKTKGRAKVCFAQHLFLIRSCGILVLWVPAMNLRKSRESFPTVQLSNHAVMKKGGPGCGAAGGVLARNWKQFRSLT